jgi:hypothetical protein
MTANGPDIEAAAFDGPGPDPEWYAEAQLEAAQARGNGAAAPGASLVEALAKEQAMLAHRQAQHRIGTEIHVGQVPEPELEAGS